MDQKRLDKLVKEYFQSPYRSVNELRPSSKRRAEMYGPRNKGVMGVVDAIQDVPYSQYVVPKPLMNAAEKIGMGQQLQPEDYAIAGVTAATSAIPLPGAVTKPLRKGAENLAKGLRKSKLGMMGEGDIGLARAINRSANDTLQTFRNEYILKHLNPAFAAQPEGYEPTPYRPRSYRDLPSIAAQDRQAMTKFREDEQRRVGAPNPERLRKDRKREQR